MCYWYFFKKKSTLHLFPCCSLYLLVPQWPRWGAQWGLGGGDVCWGQGSRVHRIVSVKCPPEPNHLLDHQESRQGLSLGSFVCCFLAETPSPVSVEEKEIPAEIRGLGGCENWERTTESVGGWQLLSCSGAATRSWKTNCKAIWGLTWGREGKEQR